jgi:hypothetical protein
MRSQFGKLIRDSDFCVLCGERAAQTKEHIPPECLFTGKPEEYLTVPACRDCNEGSKLEDDHFRDVMAAGSWTEEALEVWERRVRPKLQTRPATRIGMKNRLDTLEFTVPPLGVVPVRVLLADQARINSVLAKVVRGLFWMHSGRLLPPSAPLAVKGFNPLQLEEALRDPSLLEFIQGLPLGLYESDAAKRTFFYRGGVGEEADSAWVLAFYRNNMFIVGTGAAATGPGADAMHDK